MISRRTPFTFCALVVGAWLVLSAAGCQSSAAQRRRLSSRNPLERAQAVVRLAEMGDRGAVHPLVELLEDPDRAVRMYTILALTRLCGEDFDYKYYEPEAERAAAVRRWRAALRNGEVTVRRAAEPAAGESHTTTAQAFDGRSTRGDPDERDPPIP